LSYSTYDLIAPFWDDLDVDYGWIAYKTVGDAPQRRFVVEWFNRPHYYLGVSGVTFELVLYEGSHNLKFQYQDVIFDGYYADQGMSATIGIRGQNSDYLQYSYNNPSVTDGMALCFQVHGALPCDVEDLPWLRVSPGAGSLDLQAEATLTVAVDTEAVGLGIHRGVVRLWGNDPSHQPFIDIPVWLIVHGHEWYFPYVMHLPQLFSSLLR
jgi:hypothetical protein